MIVTKIKRKTIVSAVQISKPERYKSIDVRVPSNVTRITGILVTTTATWQNVGTVTLQAYDSSDIFYMDFVTPHNIVLSDEALMGIEDSLVNSDKPWVSGKVPQLNPVQIAGDNVCVKAWFKGGVYNAPFTLTIYLEVEAAEEYIGTELEHAQVEEEPKSFIL
jgi:hypothetical protein